MRAQRSSAHAEAALVDLFLPVSEATAAGNGLPPAGPPYIVVPNLVQPAGDPRAHEALLRELPREPFLLFVGDLRRQGRARPARCLPAMTRPAALVLIGKVWPETPPSCRRG